ncbi:MAG: response regulator [Pirellulales bacterium]
MSLLPRVLIVDESAESREILRTLLELLGATTIEAQRPEQAIHLAKLHRPHLIVLDAESDHSTRGSATDELQATAGQNDTPVVILGTLSQWSGQISGGQIIAKPYHYGPLIRKIETLLAAA